MDDLIVQASPCVSVRHHLVAAVGLFPVVGRRSAWVLLLILENGGHATPGITMTEPCVHRRETCEAAQYSRRLGGNHGTHETPAISAIDLIPVAMVLYLHCQWSPDGWHQTHHFPTSTRRIDETCLQLIHIRVQSGIMEAHDKLRPRLHQQRDLLSIRHERL